MKIQKVLSKLFSVGVKYSIYRKNINFVFGDCDVEVSEDYVVAINDNNHETKIEYCEIKDIIVEDDVVRFILQDGGYRFEDGDVFVIGRK